MFHAACDYMGEKLASLFGITSPKYQYAIDEYYRIKKEVQTHILYCLHQTLIYGAQNAERSVLPQEEEEEEEDSLAKEAERNFASQRGGKQDDSEATVKNQPEVSGASYVNVSFEVEREPSLSHLDPNRVPSPLPSWNLRNLPTLTQTLPHSATQTNIIFLQFTFVK